MTTTPSKAATEFVDLFMDSAADDVFLLGPAGVRQALLDFVARGEIRRSLYSHPHPLVEDTDPRKIEYEFVIQRAETPEEKAEREERSERRLAVLLWKPEQGPPPRGVGWLRLLQQETWWVPKDKDPIAITDMDPSWRQNTIAMLKRHAAGLKFREELATLRSCPDDPSDGVMAAFDQMQDELDSMTPNQWIESRPLIKAMVKLNRKAEKAARKAAAR
jgi:hypothetical protein